MKKNMIIAIAVVAIVVIAGIFVALNASTLFPSGNDGNNDNNDDDNVDTASDAVTSTNKTLSVSYWADTVNEADKKVSLNIDYPGEGLSSYNYSWDHKYQFNITSTPLNGYSGNVLFKMFGQKEQEIAASDIIVTNSNNKVVDFTFAKREGLYTLKNVIGGDVGSYKSNGSALGVRTFTLEFRDTLNYTFYFQAYDLDTGKAISSPVVVGPLNVPVTGSLTFKAGVGGWDVDTNGTYYAVLVEVTNDWNIRYTVNASNLYLFNGEDWVQANPASMDFKSQSLAVDQTTMFLAKFYLPQESNSGYYLQYRDVAIDQEIDITLGG